MLEDTLDIVVGIHIIIAGECKQRVVLDDQFPKGPYTGFIASRKYPPTFTYCPGYDLVGIFKKSRTFLKPHDESIANTREFAKKLRMFSFPSIIDVCAVLLQLVCRGFFAMRHTMIKASDGAIVWLPLF